MEPTTKLLVNAGFEYKLIFSFFFKNLAGPTRESNSEPLAPKARIIPLDQRADYNTTTEMYLLLNRMHFHI